MNEEVRELLSGNKLGITNFYNKYAPKINLYFSRKMSDKEDIEALTHDVLLDAVDSLSLFEGKCSLNSWLYKIAHNKLVDFYRKKKVKSLLLSTAPFLEIVAGEVYEPEFQYEKNKMRDKIESSLRKISAKYRQILSLYYDEQKSVKEISLILSLSFKATESLLFRARQKFRIIYEKE